MTILAAHCSNANDKEWKRLQWTANFTQRLGECTTTQSQQAYKEVPVFDFPRGSENSSGQITH